MTIRSASHLAGIYGLAIAFASVAAVTASPARAQDTIDCSIYGSGFVAVQGTARCVQIRGRMRVDRADPGGYRPTSYLPAPASAGVMPYRALPPRMPLQGWQR